MDVSYCLMGCDAGSPGRQIPRYMAGVMQQVLGLCGTHVVVHSVCGACRGVPFLVLIP